MTDSTPSATHSKPNPAGPDPETIRNYARPAFYLSYETNYPENTEPESSWIVRSEPDREQIGRVFRELGDFAAYVNYRDDFPYLGRFPDLWSAAQAIHNVSQHVI